MLLHEAIPSTHLQFCCSRVALRQLPHPRPATSRRIVRTPPRRFYADVKPDDTLSDFHWPEKSACAIPTPYEIFKIPKTAPYSKKRFYELVKIYHPDRNEHYERLPGCLSRAVRLERYKLIIAANEILSDPARRRAYDKYGHGWSDDSGSAADKMWARRQRQSWSGFADNSAQRNATWEDWEKWYQHRDARGKQQPVYFSNGGFVILVISVALLGAAGEVSRAGALSRSFLEQIEAVHDESSKDLMRRRRESLEFGSDKDLRVQKFLKSRDPQFVITDSSHKGSGNLMEGASGSNAAEGDGGQPAGD
jgi:curved DNA-binding protein CbpA